MKPATGKSLTGGIRILQISTHQCVAPQDEFTHCFAVRWYIGHGLGIDDTVVDRHEVRDALPRHAHSALRQWHVVPVVLPSTDRRGSKALGQTVEVGDAETHPLHPFDDRRGRCCPTGSDLDDMVKATLA